MLQQAKAIRRTWKAIDFLLLGHYLEHVVELPTIETGAFDRRIANAQEDDAAVLKSERMLRKEASERRKRAPEKSDKGVGKNKREES